MSYTHILIRQTPVSDDATDRAAAAIGHAVASAFVFAVVLAVEGRTGLRAFRRNRAFWGRWVRERDQA